MFCLLLGVGELWEVCGLRVLKETKMGFGWHKCFLVD